MEPKLHVPPLPPLPPLPPVAVAPPEPNPSSGRPDRPPHAPMRETKHNVAERRLVTQFLPTQFPA
jgi:hypothetical protein